MPRHAVTLSLALCWLAAAALAQAPSTAVAPPSSVQRQPPMVDSPEARLPRGEIVPSVVSRTDPSQSYALYLPSSYTPERRWPILYAFDARRRGALVAELFRDAAESYGWILAASNDAESDGPMEPNLKAMDALWNDTRVRFPIDEKRVYATGFSGGARVAAILALTKPGKVAGVIGCGAGFPYEWKPAMGAPFAFFGTVGNRDFNFPELMVLDKTLDELGRPHRIEVFDGPHQWPPKELAIRAIEWMEVEAMRSGRRATDPALAAALFAKGVEQARAAEAAGRLTEALHDDDAMARDFQGLVDTSAVVARAAALHADAGVQKELAAQAETDRQDAAFVEGAARTLQAMFRSDPLEVQVDKVAGELKIEPLRKKAKELGDSYDGLAARRLLEKLFVQTVFYLPRELAGRKDFRHAAQSLEIATRIKPENAFAWYQRACAESQAGERRAALDSLRHAVDAGYSDWHGMEGDADLAPLRTEKGYRELVEGLKQKQGTAGSPGTGG